MPDDETNGTEADAAGMLLSLIALACKWCRAIKVEDWQCAMLTIEEILIDLVLMMIQLKNLEV